MSYKVIVADDSQTIQKVINITLAKQPYDLIECLSEEALFKELDKYRLYFIYAYSLMFWLYLSFYVFLSEN